MNWFFISSSFLISLVHNWIKFYIFCIFIAVLYTDLWNPFNNRHYLMTLFLENINDGLEREFFLFSYMKKKIELNVVLYELKKNCKSVNSSKNSIRNILQILFCKKIRPGKKPKTATSLFWLHLFCTWYPPYVQNTILIKPSRSWVTITCRKLRYMCFSWTSYLF